MRACIGGNLRSATSRHHDYASKLAGGIDARVWLYGGGAGVSGFRLAASKTTSLYAECQPGHGIVAADGGFLQIQFG